MTLSQGDHHVRQRVAVPGVSSPEFSVFRKLDPGRICTQEVWPQNHAVSVPWLGPPKDTQASTLPSQPSNLMHQRDDRPPMEWVITSTLLAPVWALMSLIL